MLKTSSPPRAEESRSPLPVVRRAPARAAGRVVGRIQERHRIECFVERLAEAPRSLAVVGEAGIGKSTLWRYGVQLAAQAGHQVLVARPAEDDWPTPGLGLRDLLETAPGGRPPGMDVLPDDPAMVAGFFLDHLRSLAADRPVVLAIDDVQWLDELTHRLVRHALRRLDGAPVAVLGTARTWSCTGVLLPPRHTSPDAEVLQLGPLGMRELRKVLTAEGARPTRPDLERIHEVAGGNPLFAIELSRQWHHGEHQAVRRTPLGLLAEQVATLPEAPRRILQVVALAGPCPVRFVAAASGQEDVLAQLGGPLASLVELSEGYVVRCAHPLIASAARAAVPPDMRRRVHARLADLVDDPVDRARHLARSTPDPDEPVAAELERAAQAAARRGSAATAAELTGHSVRLTPAGAAQLRSARRLAEITFRAAAGQTAEALTLADRLLAELEPGAQHAQVLAQRVLLDFGGAEAYLRSALQDAGEDEPLRGMLLDLLGWQLGLFKGRVGEAIPCCEQAVAIATAHDDQNALARAAATLSTVSLLAGRPRPELMAQAEQLSHNGTSHPPGSLLRVWPGVFRARQALWDGDLAVARAGLEHASRVALSIGSEFQRPYRLRDLALLELAAGDVGAAGRLAAEGLEAAADAGNEQAAMWLAYPVGLVAALRGEPEEAAWAAGRLDAWAGRADEPLRLATAQQVRGLLAGALGNWPAALTHHLDGLARLDQLGVVHPGFLPLLPHAIEAACMTGDVSCAGELVSTLRTHAAALDSPWTEATLLLGQGQVALADGDPEAAVDLLKDAVTGFGTQGYTLDAARALYFSAAALLRSGRRADARERLTRCHDVFEAQGLVGWSRMAQESLRRVSGGADSALTPTERAIVGQVRAGLRNKEIAAELFVSGSTVEAHLTRIYRKLCVRGRQELAALRLADPDRGSGPGSVALP